MEEQIQQEILKNLQAAHSLPPPPPLLLRKKGKQTNKQTNKQTLVALGFR